MIIFIIVRKLIFGDPVSGWPSLVCIILMTSGVQFFCTGILGQYLAKAYMEVKRRPIYLVKRKFKKNRINIRFYVRKNVTK